MLHPVSPPAAAALPAPSTPEGRPWDAALPPKYGTRSPAAPAQDDEAVDFKHALLKDPIVGVELTISDENGPGAREAIPLRSPTEHDTRAA